MRLGAEVLLALILAWTLGGMLLRVGGIVLVTVGAVGLALGGGATGMIVVGIGGVLWVLGQAHHLLRHGECRSPLARLLLAGRDRIGSTAQRWIAGPTEEARSCPGAGIPLRPRDGRGYADD